MMAREPFSGAGVIPEAQKLPLIERKALLKKAIDGTAIQFSESFEVDDREMYQHA